MVNGVPVFMKGSDWIPADSFPTRMTTELLRAPDPLGGRVAPEYAAHLGRRVSTKTSTSTTCATSYGMLLWHDFMFACNIYPHDEAEFLENLRLEVDYNVRRLRHRACLALWCGNNEMEQGWADWGWTNALTTRCA